MSTSREARLSELFVELADTLTAEFDLIEFLTRLATHYVELFPADEAGVVLADARGSLHVMASSTERMRILELYELQNDEGPCLDALRTGEPVINVELAGADKRWPRFAPEARGDGFTLVHALPMRLRGRIVGVVNVFATSTERITPEDVRVAQALAGVATIGLLQERSVREGRVLTEQLQHALVTRVVIEQAKGVLAERLSVEMPDAFELLRGYARSTNSRVGDVARRVASGELLTDELRQSSGSH
jgi:GAF domain-containing protein